MHNKASSVAALCGHNPNWSSFAIRSRHTAAIPSSVAEIFDDDFPIFHARLLGNGGRIQWVSGPPGEAPAYAGTDFIIVRDGRIAALYLFFDELS